MRRLKWLLIALVLMVVAGCSTMDFAGLTSDGGSDGAPRESSVEADDYETIALEATRYQGDLIIDATNIGENNEY